MPKTAVVALRVTHRTGGNDALPSARLRLPLSTQKRVGQLRDVAFEKVEGTKSFLQEIDSDVSLHWSSVSESRGANPNR